MYPWPWPLLCSVWLIWWMWALRTAWVRCRHREGTCCQARLVHPHHTAPCLAGAHAPTLTEMGSQVFSISTIFNLPSASWPYFKEPGLAMAASGFHNTCYENTPITKYPCTVFWSSNPPAISWIIWAHLGTDTDIFPVKSITHKKLIPSVSDFFLFNFNFFSLPSQKEICPTPI